MSTPSSSSTPAATGGSTPTSSSAPLPPPKDAWASDPVVQAYTVAPGHVGNLTPENEASLAHFVLILYDKKILRSFPTPYDPVIPAAVLRKEFVPASLLANRNGELPGAPHEGPLAPEVEAQGGSQPVRTQQRIHLLRWLRAREWNVQGALQMYARAHQWKYDSPPPAAREGASPAEQAAAQQALEKASYDEVPPLELEQKLASGWTWDMEQEVSRLGWRMYFHKVDKLGRPVFIQDLAGINTSVIFQKVTPADIVEKFSVALESAIRYQYACASAHVPRTIEDNLMIVNLEGLGLSTFWAMKNQLQTLLGILDNNFPELSGRVQIINAPWVFATMFSYIKGWLPAATREKIDIVGADYKKVLLDYIPAENLPVHFGGSCTCADHAPNVHNTGSASQTAPTSATGTPSVANGTKLESNALDQHLESLSLQPSPNGQSDETKSAPPTPLQLAGSQAPTVPGGWCTVSNAGSWPESYHAFLHRRVGNKLHSHTSVEPFDEFKDGKQA